MTNPFHYGTVVVGDAFCNRTEELRDVERAFENGEKLFIYSERRLGKTSLVRTAIERLPRRRFLAVYVDLWPTDSEVSFATATAQAISLAAASTPGRLLDTAKQLFSRLVPSVSVNDEGKPIVTFGTVVPRKPEVDIEDVLKAPEKLAAQRNRKVVVVFDEVQRILEYESDLVERKLRSMIQHQGEVGYLFLGSRKHLIRRMFLDKSRPLYRAAGHYPLGPIGAKHWIGFIRKRFLDAQKEIDDETIRSICGLTEGHPFYTQHLCHALWELCAPGTRATDDLVETALGVLLDRESYAYTMLWESLAANQRRLLRGLVLEPLGAKPFSSAFTRRYGLRSASNVQRASGALIEADVVDPENGSFVIVDRFFKLWIRKQQSGRGASE